ncbi:HAMP domain-containing histidine kinase [Vibrio sp. ZSDZ65]|uniref:histidine kinase n=1 Tax=Vibrio qingdaonensis TaxID=2829491 RepID=A0A9X3HW22_9VIBR|nr:HAMP domain-containing sensor histidine kinase [Vibrio qingdaonensis]MCW8345936.1 HAMP domain-containing histidine kinase [Vibrio qingdaonensis]
MTFSIMALSSSFLVFFSFSLYLVFNEDNQIERHLVSFEQVAIQHHALDNAKVVSISPNVTAYFSEQALTERLKAQAPYPLNEVTRYNRFSEDGFLVFHTEFIDKTGTLRPLYLSVGMRALDFGDDSWDSLMLVALALMLMLIAFLRVSLQRMLGGLMSPIADLSEQLKSEKAQRFSVSSSSIDEVKQLADHLNSYTQMKDRLVKQELMFAKYASHELKTPISIILGAANLQAMKQQKDFQARQRQRIIHAAEGMQATVEVLLNIVKQENTEHKNTLTEFSYDDIDVQKSISKRHPDVQFTLKIADNTPLNFPPAVLNMLLKNLIDNSARFTKQGHINVEVTSQAITVTDSGCGISGQNETEHGLGLLIVQRLCASYGWSFTLSNNAHQAGCTAHLERES